MLTCVRWYVAYPLSLRHLEEMIAERGIAVDHSTVHRWAIKLLPALEKAFRRCKRAVGKSWRMYETYVKVCGEWKYPYRAVDKEGNTVDFLLRARRNKAAAQRYFEKSIQQNGVPETVTIDKSGANLAALHAVNAKRDTPIKVRQVKYLNNVVEQDHQAIKRIIRPMLGFKDFHCARVILRGIEVMHMIRKGQMKDFGKIPLSPRSNSTRSFHKQYIAIAFASPSRLAATKPSKSPWRITKLHEQGINELRRHRSPATPEYCACH
jgi:transposase-like protein